MSFTLIALRLLRLQNLNYYSGCVRSNCFRRPELGFRFFLAAILIKIRRLSCGTEINKKKKTRKEVHFIVNQDYLLRFKIFHNIIFKEFCVRLCQIRNLAGL